MAEVIELRVRMMDYMIHFKCPDRRIEFEVYPVQDWEHIFTKETGFHYIDLETEPNEREVFEEGKCVMKLEGSFCWRGVWEGRLYFPDSEYWGEEIAKLSELYNDHIVPWCKNYIKEKDPHDYYTD